MVADDRIRKTDGRAQMKESGGVGGGWNAETSGIKGMRNHIGWR